MKTTVIIFAMVGLSSTLFAQWTTSDTNIFNSNTGNVGIGTSTPNSKLDLQGLNVTFGIFKSKFTGTESATKGRLEIKADPLDQGLLALTSLNRFGDASEDLIYTLQQPLTNATSWNILESWRGAGLLLSASGPDLKPLLFGIDRIERARLTSNGNFGIGTTLVNNPNGYKLAVNGKIGAKEVQVESTSTTWADYVFEPTYNLMPIAEVESFIKLNKHLPEIPSAEEIKINGHKLGEMDVLLLKKVEELTLYMIDMKKENQQMKKEIEELKSNRK